MENMIDIRKLLKKYHSFIYTGNRRVDLDLMMQEIRTLYENGLIPLNDYQKAMLVLKKEVREMDV